jgi:hypothetical protein
MTNREEIKSVWLNAYNAALTGLLASNTHIGIAKNAPTPSVGVVEKTIGEMCKAFAVQAVKDFEESAE